MERNIVLNNINEKFIKEIADSKFILKNGHEYFRLGRVKSLDVKGETIEAVVKGKSDYKVKINFDMASLDEDDDYFDNDPIIECSCPYPGYGCKHVVAVLYKLLEGINKEGVKDSKRKGYSPFNDIKFGDIIKLARTEKIVKAFDILRYKKFHIENFDREKFFITVEDGKRYRVGIWSVNFGKMKTFNLIESCSCGRNRKIDPCEHLLTARLLLLKRVKPKEIPVSYEKEIREDLEKENYGSFVQKLSMRDIPQKRKKEYVLYFSIKQKGRAILFSAWKSLILRSGRRGKISPVSVYFVKNRYHKFSEHEKRVFDLMYSTLNDRGNYFYYNSYNGRVEKDDFMSERDFRLLDYLREIYKESPESFIDVEIPDKKAVLEFSFENKIERNLREKRYVLNIGARFDEQVFQLNNEKISVFGGNALWLFVPPENDMKKGVLMELDCVDPRIVRGFIESKEMEFSEFIFHRIIEEQYESLSRLGEVRLPKDYGLKEISEVEPKPRIFLRDYGPGFCIELRFLYENREVLFKNDFDVLLKDKNGQIIKIKRNKEIEKKIADKLKESSEFKEDIFLPTIGPIEWLTEKSQELALAGFEIYGQDSLLNFKINNSNPELRLELKSGIDWFDIKVDVRFGEEKVGFDKIKEALRRHERFIRLSDGSLGVIPEKWIAKLGGVAGFLGENEDGSIKAAHTQIQIIEGLVGISDKSSVDRHYEEIRNKFKQFRTIGEVPLPRGLNGQLREYQMAGYYWLHFLKDFSFGGCLADEMGLGKTLQILALLLYEKENSKDVKTSLVVVPTSLIFNWVQEIRKFAPSLRVYVHHGVGRFKNLKKVKNIDVVLTTYGTLRNDVESFKEKEFYYAILDESQQIKNPLTKSTQSAYSLNAKHRLVLTGTPVENNYLELWSQFSFLNPGLLGTIEHFKEAFMSSADKKRESIRSDSLKNIINPFLLMRKKEHVAKDLPDKQITTIYCDMSEEQRVIYEAWKTRYRNEIKESIDTRGFNQSRFKILEGLLRLRQICNHPSLVDESYLGKSEKFDVLFNQIREIVEEGHKVLVFSSFVKMLQIFKGKFLKEGTRFCYLDGQTKNRKEVVEEFQNNENVKVFLISLKAGGVGLNLTAADYVFIVDPWWNPAVEMQAIDRAHRIGQNKKIFVYKAITKDSVEEKILELQNSKKMLVEKVVVGEEGIFKRLTPDDINYFFETKEREF